MKKKLSTIFYSYHVANFINNILKSQLNLELKNTYFYTKYLHKVAVSLFKARLIANVQIVKDSDIFIKNIFNENILFKKYCPHWSVYNRSKLIIFFKYINERPLINSIQLFSRPGRQIFISSKRLQIIYKLNPGSVYILSTPQYGLTDHITAVKNNKGGILLFKIN